MSASTVTSGISVTRVGTSVRNKKSIYTATEVTRTGDPAVYTTEIIRYSDAKGNNPVTIGTRDTKTGKINFNADASATEKKYSSTLGQTSTIQISSVADSIVLNASDKALLNASAGQSNQALGSGVQNRRPVGGQGGNKSRYSSGVAGGADNTQSKDAAANIIKPSKAKPGTRTNFGGAGGGLIFPSALSSIDRDIIKFNMMEYRPSGMGSASGGDGSIASMGTGRAGKGKILGTVMLPVPAGISDNASVDWGSGSMSPIDAAMANIAMEGVQKGLGKAGEMASAGLEEAKKNSDDVKKALAATIASTASGIGKQALQRGEGMVTNPNMELLFNGPSLRSFSFNFKLSPRSAREAKTVIQIIRFFKQGMAPQMSESGFFLKAPNTFQLEYKKGNNKGENHKYLNRFKECALQSCGVQYTPDGTYNTFDDGVMASYSLQLTFGELEPIFNDDYENPQFKIGRDEIGF